MIFISTQQKHSSPLCLTQVEDADRWLLKRETDSIFGCCWFFQISSASWDNSSLRWWGWCWGGSLPTCRKAPAKLPVTKHRYQQHSLLRVSCLLTAKEDGGRGGSQPMSVRRHSRLISSILTIQLKTNRNPQSWHTFYPEYCMRNTTVLN